MALDITLRLGFLRSRSSCPSLLSSQGPICLASYVLCCFCMHLMPALLTQQDTPCFVVGAASFLPCVRASCTQQRRAATAPIPPSSQGGRFSACLLYLRSALPCPRAHSTLTPRTQRTQTPPRMRSAFSCTVAWQALASARPAPSIPASHSLTPPSPSPILPAHLHRQPWLSTHRRLTWRRTTLASCGGVTRPPRPLPPSSPHIYTDNHGVRHTVA